MRCASLLLLAVLGLSCRAEDELISDFGPAISLEVQHLNPLPPGEGHYEAWISFANPNRFKASGAQGVETSFVSIGTFNVGASGKAIGLGGEPFVGRLAKERNPQYMVDAIITIQPETDTDHVSGSVIIGGEVKGDIRIGRIDLSTNYHDAFRSNFRTADGYFLLNAPTSNNSADSASGIWFMKSLTPNAAGLMNLPELREGWTYEGWVRTCCVGGAGNSGFLTYSTGKFLSPAGFDADSAGLRKGPVGSGYPFPGEDYVGVKRLALNNELYEVMITIEPDPDNSTEPFQVFTLFGPTPISGAVSLGQGQQMSNSSAFFPTARITVIR